MTTTEPENDLREAEKLLAWYIEDSDTDACGLRGASWSSFTTEGHGEGGANKAQRVVVAPVATDGDEDRDERMRARLRFAHASFTALRPDRQAVLLARFLPRGREQLVPGLGDVTFVAQELPGVRRAAEEQRTTPQQVLRQRMRAGQGRALVEAANAAVQDALAAFDAERRRALESDRAKRKARLEMLRGSA